MKIALFLGAGASVPFGKPTTAELKEKLFNKYIGAVATDIFHEILFSFLTHPEFQDIEYVLQSVKELTHTLGGYGGKYLLDQTRGEYVKTGMHDVHISNFYNELKKVEKRLEDEIFESYSWKTDEDDNLFIVDDVIFSFLKEKPESIRVFTTNYDQAIERYCELKDELRLVDGFKYDENKQKLIWADGDYSYCDKINDDKKNVYLYKLHGSLNWKEHKSGKIERTSEESVVADPKYTANMLIYPTLSPKDGYEKEPYKSIRDNFEKSMKSIDICIVIGFSFRDQHVNEILESFIKNNKTLIIISPHAIRDYRMSLLKEHHTEEEVEHWKDTPFVKHQVEYNGIRYGTICAIQKKLEVGTVEEIVHDIKSVIEPDKHPF